MTLYTIDFISGHAFVPLSQSVTLMASLLTTRRKKLSEVMINLPFHI